MPATAVQTLGDRLTKALKRFVPLRNELGLPGGFPRFKTPSRWHSSQLRQDATHRDVWLDEDGKHMPMPAKLGRLLKINPTLSFLWSRRRSRRDCGQEHRTGASTAFRDGSRRAAG